MFLSHHHLSPSTKKRGAILGLSPLTLDWFISGRVNRERATTERRRRFVDVAGIDSDDDDNDDDGDDVVVRFDGQGMEEEEEEE